METLTPEQRDALFTTFEREALHLEMRDVYAVQDEAERFVSFLAGKPRDREAETAERAEWLTLMRHATQAGKRVRRARIASEPVTDYIRFEHEGTDLNIEAGEDVRWLPRRLASGIALPGNDFWLFDDTTAVFNIFTGNGDIAFHDLTTDRQVVQLCKLAFTSVWEIAIPHNEYKLH